MPQPLPDLPEGASWPRRVALGLRALAVARDEPGNPKAGALINRCFDWEVYADLRERALATEEGRRLLRERPSLQAGDVDLDALAALPEGTLGRAFAEYYLANGITPFVTTQDGIDDLDYLSKRYRETHDLHHLITGYGTDPLGEMELQSFIAGNLGLRSAAFIAAVGYAGIATLNTWVMPHTYVATLRAARQRGRAARFLLTFPFEDHWGDRVEDLRATLLPETALAA